MPHATTPYATPTAGDATVGAPGLHWPAPHHLRVIELGNPEAPERALVTLLGGDKQLGLVRRIDFDAGELEFQPSPRQPARILPFDQIRSIFLSRVVELESMPLPVPPGGVVRKATLEHRACRVAMRDGFVLETQVVAVLRRKAGLFLYVVHYGDAVLRWFIPASAIEGYQVGVSGEVGSLLDPGEEAEAGAASGTGAGGSDLEGGDGASGRADDADERTQESGGARVATRGGGGGRGQLRPVIQAGEAANLDDFLGDALESRQELERALKRVQVPHRRLGELLLQERVIDDAQLREALAQQAQREHALLGDLLLEMGAVTRDQLHQVLVSQLGVPAVKLARFPYDPNALKLLKPELARKYRVIPLYRDAERVVVAMEDPLSWQALHELEFATDLRVDPVLATPAELAAAIAQFYGGAWGSERIGQLVARLDEERAAARPAHHEEVVTESDNTLVRLVNKMIVDAFDAGASDIHIESVSSEKPTKVRLRVDGVLKPYIEVPPNFRQALVSRIKVMCDLDISEHRRPQDGKIHSEDFGPRAVELRVVTLPTAHGLEDVVMRLLEAPRTLVLEQLGLPARSLATLKTLATHSFGLLFVCGPTGSGKTTTLHALLATLNTPERKILTVEDPVEISQEGLVQVQVNAKLGLTFPNVLRSFLRADPDIIMVGETRDAETAHTATAASLTGHLVFSTMHTNSAAESIVRLLDLDVDPFNFSDALLGVLGQRLVGRLCECKTAHVASESEVRELAEEYCRATGQAVDEVIQRWRQQHGQPDGSLLTWQPAGCQACGHTGYKGRLGVYELMVASPALRQAIRNRASAAELLRIAVGEGMTTLEQDAIEKILQGHTDLKQVLLACR